MTSPPADNSNIIVDDFISNVTLKEGIWYTNHNSEVSYPKQGNVMLFHFEDTSFWYQHRNHCILAAIRSYEPKGPLFDIGGGNGFVSQAIQESGYDVLRDYAGHGIGKSMHEDPEIPCYGTPHEGDTIKEGMLLAIETLVCEGLPKVEYINTWETKMADNKDWVSFEHTVLVTKDGYDIVTSRENI